MPQGSASCALTCRRAPHHMRRRPQRRPPRQRRICRPARWRLPLARVQQAARLMLPPLLPPLPGRARRWGLMRSGGRGWSTRCAAWRLRCCSAASCWLTWVSEGVRERGAAPGRAHPLAPWGPCCSERGPRCSSVTPPRLPAQCVSRPLPLLLACPPPGAGAPDGYGPTGLSEEGLEQLLAAVAAHMDAACAADVTVVRRRKVWAGWENSHLHGAVHALLLCPAHRRPWHAPGPASHCLGACPPAVPARLLQVPAPTVGEPDHHVADVCIRRRVGAASGPLEVRPARSGGGRGRWHVGTTAAASACMGWLSARSALGT